MMCYKDMTFCGYWKECRDGKKCLRALTEDVEKRAEKCNLLIAQFGEKPDCFKEIDDGDND